MDQKSKRNNVFGLHNHSIFLNNLIGSYSLPSIYCIFLYCRLMHLILLAFNYLSVKSLSTLSGGSQSVFSKKENAIAVLLVASQVSECAFELVTFPYRWQQTKDVLLFFLIFKNLTFFEQLWNVFSLQLLTSHYWWRSDLIQTCFRLKWLYFYIGLTVKFWLCTKQLH